MCNTSHPRLLVVPRYMPWTGRDPLHGVTESMETVRELTVGDTDTACIILLLLVYVSQFSPYGQINRYLLKPPQTRFNWLNVCVGCSKVHSSLLMSLLVFTWGFLHGIQYFISAFTTHAGNLYGICRGRVMFTQHCYSAMTLVLVSPRQTDITMVHYRASNRLVGF